MKQSDLKIETDRLILRRETAADYKDAYLWSGDPAVTKYMLASAAESPEDLIPWLSNLDLDSVDSYVMILRDKYDDHPIGSAGIFYDEDDGCWNIAYMVRQEEWGKGYATEAAAALMKYVTETFQAERFRGECAVENQASAKVLEKLGMRYDHNSSYRKNDGSAVYESKVYYLDHSEKN